MTIVAVGVLLASSFATFGQWRWLIGVYPTVADTELDRLGYWLALVQLDEQPSELRRSLVDRFQRELAGGWSPLKSEDATESVDLEAYRDQIASNIELLMRDWFYYRCEQYVEVNEASRVWRLWPLRFRRFCFGLTRTARCIITARMRPGKMPLSYLINWIFGLSRQRSPRNRCCDVGFITVCCTG